MKNYFGNLLFFLFLSNYAFSQNVINPYQTISPLNIANNLTIYPPSWYDFNFTQIPYSWGNRSTISGYAGEYEINLKLHPWNEYLNIGPGYGLYLTYGMEAVSFPFMPECTFNATGCSALIGTSTRDLVMPADAYNSDPNNPQGWGLLSNILPFPRRFNNNIQALASEAFAQVLIVSNNYAKVLPHTVIKHTVYVHCQPLSTSPPTAPVIYSFSWLYDNTRGRMRYYPFCNCNCDLCNETEYDVFFEPELLINYQGHNFNETDNQIIMSNGTINYFPFNELANLQPCTEPETLLPVSFSTYMSGLSTGAPFYNFIYFPPYSLVSAPLLQHRGKNIAGYQEDPINNTQVQAMNGLKHSYYIDRNIDMTVVNPIEKNIYNPSEVTFTSGANNFHFPSGYSFKTVRGVYPTVAEVTADNILANGGPFDERNVPIRTDLRCENINYPHDPLIPAHSVYASIYKLTDLSQVTIEPCVKIFDATFDVQPGGTLLFDDYPNTLNPDRFKVLGNGGAIAKNLSPIQYLQNTTVTQPQQINYTAFNAIYAGTAVDPDPTVAPNPYILDAGSHVSFISEGDIYLKGGFDALAGSSFDAITGTLAIPTPCDPPPPSNGNRISPSTTTTNKGRITGTSLSNQLQVYPNPGSGIFYAELNKPSTTLTWKVLDLFGREIKTGSGQSNKTEINLEGTPTGIYYLQAEVDGKIYQEKLVKK